MKVSSLGKWAMVAHITETQPRGGRRADLGRRYRGHVWTGSIWSGREAKQIWGKRQSLVRDLGSP